MAWHWTYRELDRRSKLAAFRLRALGLQPGDRLLTWSPSSPELPAVYFGAMRARLIVVPLDLRMAPDTVARIVDRAGARFAVLGTGRDAPDPHGSGLGDLPLTTTADLTADPPDPARLPPDWEAQVDAWERPTREDLFEVVFTSGTTGVPKGVMLTHGAILSSIDAFGLVIPPMEHRVGVAAAALAPDRAGGRPVLRHAGRRRHPLHPLAQPAGHLRGDPRPARHHAAGGAGGAGAVLDGADARGGPARAARAVRARQADRTSPALRSAPRALPQRPPPVRRQASGSPSPPAHTFRPGCSRHGRTSASSCCRATGRPSAGSWPAPRLRTTHPGPWAASPRPADPGRPRGRRRDRGRGPTLLSGYWGDPEATAAAIDAEGWYHTGDVARFDERGNLVLLGRTRNVIVLPNGFNVFPEDIENALHDAGLSETVVLETEPGRIEAIVLPPERAAMMMAPDTIAPARVRPGATPRSASGSTPRSARPTPTCRSTSASTAGASGRAPTSRARTPSRCAGTKCSDGRRPKRRCRWSIRSGDSGRHPGGTTAPVRVNADTQRRRPFRWRPSADRRTDWRDPAAGATLAGDAGWRSTASPARNSRPE